MNKLRNERVLRSVPMVGLAPVDGAPPAGLWAMLGVAIIIALAVALIRRRARRRLAAREGEPAAEVARALRLEGAPIPLLQSQAPADVLASGGQEATRATVEQSLHELLATLESAREQLECPQCKRTFPALLERCPYDGRALVDAPLAQPPRARRSCARCGRRYEAGARYCPVDGLVLSDDVGGKAAHATFRVCRSCGHEARPHETRCPHDGETLVPLESVEKKRVAPTVPLLRCRRCGRYGAPGQMRCPVDNTLMMPELDVRLTALPPTGFGPRRKICIKCGESFSARCDYCSFDGEALVGLN